MKVDVILPSSMWFCRDRVTDIRGECTKVTRNASMTGKNRDVGPRMAIV